jgi:hypothetical protein
MDDKTIAALLALPDGARVDEAGRGAYLTHGKHRHGRGYLLPKWQCCQYGVSRWQ